jgi:hypothetical protein
MSKPNPIADTESSVFQNANRLITDAQNMRQNPVEALPGFKERTVALTLAALELITHQSSPEDAAQIVQALADKYLQSTEHNSDLSAV